MIYLQGRKGFDLKVCTGEVPKPGIGEVLVKVLMCGICGTDLHFLNKMEDYTPLGHEIAAVVEETGPGVSRVVPGDAVIVEDQAYCGVCEACKCGHHERCSHMYGLDGQSGMGEYLCVNERNLVPCPQLTPEQASLVEPSVVAYHAALASRLERGDAAVVWGLGPIGLLCVPVLKYFGASAVYCVGHHLERERNQKRAALACELGADEVWDAEADSLPDQIPEHARAVIVTSPPATAAAAIKTAPFTATIVLLGIALNDTRFASIDIDDVIFGKKQIASVLTEPSMHFPDCIRLIREGIIPAEKYITHKIPLRDTEAFRNVFLNDTGVVKAVVVP